MLAGADDLLYSQLCEAVRRCAEVADAACLREEHSGKAILLDAGLTDE